VHAVVNEQAVGVELGDALDGQVIDGLWFDVHDGEPHHTDGNRFRECGCNGSARTRFRTGGR